MSYNRMIWSSCKVEPCSTRHEIDPPNDMVFSNKLLISSKLNWPTNIQFFHILFLINFRGSINEMVKVA
ncbi:hypothetical protein AMTRI_Chr09g14690 [Amborella trichopoda]